MRVVRVGVVRVGVVRVGVVRVGVVRVGVVRVGVVCVGVEAYAWVSRTCERRGGVRTRMWVSNSETVSRDK